MTTTLKIERSKNDTTTVTQLGGNFWQKIIFAHKEAEELFNWILDMFNNSNNSEDMIHLHQYFDTEMENIDDRSKIKVGNEVGEGLTQRRFDYKTMNIVVQMFNETDGYAAKIYPPSYPDECSTVVIFKS